MTKKPFKNIYKTTTRKSKKSIDFDEKMCYYIFKEREYPKTSREVGTGAFQIFEGRKVQWKGELLAGENTSEFIEVRVAEKE